jgi:glycosyltransferase involved in cell wall biosynthesis
MKNSPANSPIISVIMITYGHEQFIEQAINGVLMQECDFEVELIIANDGSPDQTDKVIQNVLENHPKASWIKYIKHEKNLGMMPNFIFAKQQCKGEFVAMCEGDDYWTDPLKLQKQVDFLEANPDYVLCFHNVEVLQDGVIKEDTITAKVPETTTINDLAKGNFIHTCSVVYRNNLFSEFPPYFNESPVGDYFLHLLNARYGKIKCFEEIMGVYRVHGTSVWSSKTQKERELLWVPFLENIKPNFDQKVQEILNAQIAFYTKPVQKPKSSNMANIKNKIIQKVKRLFEISRRNEQK